jgi:hypothetical protein
MYVESCIATIILLGVATSRVDPAKPDCGGS